ncbi:MAG: hypothetical protein COB66_01070 [Coxiella sp. (in: Bacteria)]|nr:MAG: hypothetical protein COB66_01070 [Coxiella sp. (in: g-proteobacteria)]
MTWRSQLLERRFYYVIGLAGITVPEVRKVRRIGQVFSSLMIVIAVILLLQWQWYLLRQITSYTNFILSWIVFMFFGITYTIELLIVNDRWRYVGQNWSLPLIILSGLPFLIEYQPLMQPLAALRPLLAIYILFPSLKMLISFFLDGHLRTTILGAAVVVVIFGVLVAGVDPGVKTIWDGMWWAIATVSTIGYGDVVPTSALGRLLGAILVVISIAIFVIITANILAFTLKKARHKIEIEEEKLRRDVDEMKIEQQEQTKLLKSMNEKLKKLDDKKS